jgi:hypothetical protein
VGQTSTSNHWTRHFKIDHPEDVAMDIDEHKAGAELILKLIEDLDTSERTWKSISKILKQFEDDWADATAAADDLGVEPHRGNTERRLDVLAGIIVEAAKRGRTDRLERPDTLALQKEAVRIGCDTLT